MENTSISLQIIRLSAAKFSSFLLRTVALSITRTAAEDIDSLVGWVLASGIAGERETDAVLASPVEGEDDPSMSRRQAFLETDVIRMTNCLPSGESCQRLRRHLPSLNRLKRLHPRRNRTTLTSPRVISRLESLSHRSAMKALVQERLNETEFSDEPKLPSNLIIALVTLVQEGDPPHREKRRTLLIEAEERRE